jgi:hypothetical protein
MRAPFLSHHRAAIAAAFLSAATSGAQTQATPSLTPVLVSMPGSSLTIRGSTTIGARWHCTTDLVAAHAVMGSNSGSPVESADAVRSVSVSVRVWDLRCQSRPMERAMRKAMRAEHDTAATIVGSFAAPHERSQAEAAHLDGALVVAGVQRAVWLEAAVAPEIDGSLRVTSTVPLLLSSFRITPPRVLFGSVRARDAITVEVDLRFPATVRALQAADSQRRD